MVSIRQGDVWFVAAPCRIKECIEDRFDGGMSKWVMGICVYGYMGQTAVRHQRSAEANQFFQFRRLNTGEL